MLTPIVKYPLSEALPSSTVGARRMVIILMSADAAAMLVAAVICISLATAFGAKMTLAQAAASWPVVMLAALCYSVARLYSASSLNPPDELRKVASCSLVLFLVAESVNGYGSGM